MSYKPLILFIEDDKAIRSFMHISLEAQGYRYIDADTAKNGLCLFYSHNPDIVVLDLGLPDSDGITVIEAIRTGMNTPIIIVSARGHDQDKISALDAGADDYLTKPFSVSELSARIRVALRHRNSVLQNATTPITKFCVGELVVDYDKRRVLMQNQDIHLTPIEFKLMELLSIHAGRVLTHNYMIKMIWGNYNESNTQSLRVYMANLRRKIEIDTTKPRYFMTEVGIGYRLVDE